MFSQSLFNILLLLSKVYPTVSHSHGPDRVGMDFEIRISP